MQAAIAASTLTPELLRSLAAPRTSTDVDDDRINVDSESLLRRVRAAWARASSLRVALMSIASENLKEFVEVS